MDAAVEEVKMVRMFTLTGVGDKIKKDGQHFFLLKINMCLILSVGGKKLMLVE